MKFRYTGVTKQKEEVRGVLDAADEVEARMRLRAMQVRPIEIERAPEPVIGEKLIFLVRPPVNLKGLGLFTRQFSSLIDSGVPVAQCLSVLHDQEVRPRFRRILATIKSDIEAGSGLAEALSKHPNVFSEFFVRIVEAGEMSGTLDTALRRAGNQIEKIAKLRSKVIGAMVYPAFTLVAAIAILIFMLVRVIPSISQLYMDAQSQLPELTLAVLSLSEWVQQNLLWLFGLTILCVVAFAALYRQRGFREVWDRLVLRVPLFGSLILKSGVARFARTLATLISSGVPLLQAFEICVKIMENRAIKNALGAAANAVSEGKSLAQGLAFSGVFPVMVIHMVNVGEMTGRLDELLNKVGDIYEEDVDALVQNLTGILQPALIISVGLLIAFLLLAMYLPIFQLAEKISGGM